jgi:hypothetical protein
MADQKAATDQSVQVTATVNGFECKPNPVILQPRQSVQWQSALDILIDFREDTPFDEGSQFLPFQPATVRENAESRTYTPVISVRSGSRADLKAAIGDVVVDRPSQS